MKRLDLTVLIGLLVGLAAVIGSAALEGIRPAFLWQPTAALVVLGGTLGAVTVKRGIRGIVSAVTAAAKALFSAEDSDELDATVARLAWLARTSRREGVKVFENYAESTSDPMIAGALTLVAEYADERTVRLEMDRMLAEEDERGRHDAATLEAAGGYSPTFGILGAVLGLIHVLRSLDQPSALGMGIATAFVATIYGVGAANLILFPLGSRLREREEQRMRRREVLADALVAIAAHELPINIARRFASRAPADARETAGFARKAGAQ